MIELTGELGVTLAAAFMLGLLSSAHCVGMCGGIMGALALAIPASERRRRVFLLLCYNLGRILSYTLMGLLTGLFFDALAGSGGVPWLRLLAGLLLIAMGLYLGNWWRGLTWLERGGSYLWRYLQPLGRRLMPVTRLPQALALGAIWGWLPCGLVYTALVYATTQAQAFNAGAVMLAFGLGTLPAVLATGLAAERLTQLLRRPRLRWFFALLIILFGLWTIAFPVSHLFSAGHHTESESSHNSQNHEHHH